VLYCLDTRGKGAAASMEVEGSYCVGEGTSFVWAALGGLQLLNRRYAFESLAIKICCLERGGVRGDGCADVSDCIGALRRAGAREDYHDARDCIACRGGMWVVGSLLEYIISIQRSVERSICFLEDDCPAADCPSCRGRGLPKLPCLLCRTRQVRGAVSFARA
jgi:hypothetical protein